MSINFPISLETHILAFAATLALSLSFTAWLAYFLKGSHPLAQFLLHHSRSHKEDEEVSPFGGLAVVASFLIVLWGSFYLGWIHIFYLISFLLVTVGVLAMILLGFVDDLVNLKARFKLMMQLVIALFLVFNGLTANQIGDFNWAWLGAAWSLLWIAGITNGFNLVDGQDGLSGGLAFITCGFAAMIFWNREIYEASLLATLLAGSVLGFLFFNFPPARIYLGNTGSLPLGLLVSLIFVSAWTRGFQDEVYLILPLSMLLVPISDTVFAFFRRIFKGVSPFARDTDHLHHRLVKLGFTVRQSISILFGLTLYFDLVTLIYIRNIDRIPFFTPLFVLFLMLNVCLMIATLVHLECARKGERLCIRHLATNQYVLIGGLLIVNIVFFIKAW
ncbi:MraY family glycosyltransferase [Nitrospina watsonii]|uniref:Undecaprenyl-phosphate N-acetylglucosaminyl 1-phosphate transferase n=1 Tax=Nitrospina watsonii TaxID=1323948 RepID=A0ABM9HA06_9BACT|nr:MraY family glycosyltransferase [Nitrospina watsonii]CAI2716992.1 putative undecaprenyl-phosphate N-acetylglucosaminyl 1-phosphate transferase [Nitrospina watsonii]